MNQFENDPRLKNLMPLKRQIILELANGSHNATMEQMLPPVSYTHLTLPTKLEV